MVHLAVLEANIVREVFVCFENALVILPKCHDDILKWQMHLICCLYYDRNEFQWYWCWCRILGICEIGLEILEKCNFSVFYCMSNNVVSWESVSMLEQLQQQHLIAISKCYIVFSTYKVSNNSVIQGNEGSGWHLTRAFLDLKAKLCYGSLSRDSYCNSYIESKY